MASRSESGGLLSVIRITKIVIKSPIPCDCFILIEVDLKNFGKKFKKFKKFFSNSKSFSVHVQRGKVLKYGPPEKTPLTQVDYSQKTLPVQPFRQQNIRFASLLQFLASIRKGMPLAQASYP